MSAELLETASFLASRGENSSRSDLCAAVSTTYYALFETLAKLAADLFIGKDISNPPPRAWRHLYRSLEHHKITEKCSKEALKRFPREVIDFADLFMIMQHERELSDYEFGHSPALNFVVTTIERTRVKIEKFLSAEEKHLRAFCVFVMVEKHRYETPGKKLHVEAAKARDQDPQ